MKLDSGGYIEAAGGRGCEGYGSVAARRRGSAGRWSTVVSPFGPIETDGRVIWSHNSAPGDLFSDVQLLRNERNLRLGGCVRRSNRSSGITAFCWGVASSAVIGQRIRPVQLVSDVRVKRVSFLRRCVQLLPDSNFPVSDNKRRASPPQVPCVSRGPAYSERQF